MPKDWINQEWDDLCERLNRCAAERDSDQFQQQAEQFVAQSPPDTYQQVLDRVRQAAKLAIATGSAEPPAPADSAEQTTAAETASPFDPQHGIVDAIDEAGMESFPASDASAHY